MPSLTRDKLLLPPLNIIECPDGSGSGNTGDGNTEPTFLVGAVISHMASADYVPEGCVRADGSEYTESEFKSMYNNFLMTGKLVTCTYSEYDAQLLISGNCGKFALDTVNKKFKVPLLKDGDSITHAASAAELGKSVKAGLPNIAGGFSNALGGKDASGWGCLTVTRDTNTYNVSSTAPGDLGYNSLNVDASQAGTHAVYGKSSTVTDEQIRLRHFVVIASAQNNQSMFDWSNYMAALAGKANTDFSNVDLNVALQPSMAGSATLNGTTDNTVQLTDIVTTLGLEVGDVIRIQYGGYNKLHSVESITNNNLIRVNYEHAGNRGNGSLKLANTTASVTITRIAKWYNAPLGLGQAWVDVTALRQYSTTYSYLQTRGMQVGWSLGTGSGVGWSVNGVSVRLQDTGNNDNDFVSPVVPAGADYTSPAKSGSGFRKWVELR